MKFEYYSEYYPEILLQVSSLNKKLKLMRGTTKHFPKKLLGHKIFRSIVTWATNFLKIFVKAFFVKPYHEDHLKEI